MKNKKKKIHHHTFCLTSTATVVGLMLAGATAPSMGQSLTNPVTGSHDINSDEAYNTTINIGINSGSSGDVNIINNATLTFGGGATYQLGANANAHTSAGGDGIINIGSASLTGNTFKLDSSTLILGGRGGDGLDSSAYNSNNGKNGGNGAVNLSANNTFVVTGNSNNLILGGNGGQGGDAEIIQANSGTNASGGTSGSGGSSKSTGSMGGNGGSGTVTITGSDGTAGITTLAVGGAGGKGGRGGWGGNAGNGDKYVDGSNTGTGGSGGYSAGANGGTGGSGDLTILGGDYVVTTLTIGGKGGDGGNGYLGGDGGNGGNANAFYNGGSGGYGGSTIGGTGGRGGDGTVRLSNSTITVSSAFTVGGAGGYSGSSGTSGTGGSGGAGWDDVNGNTGHSGSSNSGSWGGSGGNGGTINNPHNGGNGGNGGGLISSGGRGGDGVLELDNTQLTAGGNITIGGKGNSGAGGNGQISVLNGSGLDASTNTITVGGSNSGGKGLFEIGKNTTITASNIILNAAGTTSSIITNALFNTKEGGTSAVVSDVTITYGQMNVKDGNLDMRGNNITLNAANSANSEINVQNNWLYAEELRYASQGGKVTVDNSIMAFNTLDTSGLAISNNASFHLKDTNGVAIIGNDTSSWDGNATDPSHRAETLEWARHQIVVSGHNPANYTGGILAFRGLKDSSGNAQSLDFSKLGSVGFGTATAVNKGNGGMFGQNSLTIVNAPAYMLNNSFYNDNPGNVAVIKIDAGNNNNPFEAGGTNTKLMAVLDNNTKTGDSFIVLENTGGNFNVGANDGWLKQGNAFTTSRLHTLNVWQGDGTVINTTGSGGSVTTNGGQLIGTIGGADPIMTMPGVSNEVAHLLKETASQVGHNVGDVYVNGNAISSGVHFVSRASDKMYVPDDVTSANVMEGAVRLASIGGAQAAVMRSNIASADIIHGRATTFDPGIFLSSQTMSFTPDYSTSDATTSASQFIEPGFGVWVMPVHQNAKIKDIEIGNTFKTGFDGKFTGLIAGFDYTTPKLMRFGISIDGGKGDVESTNHVQPTKNDFDYWGVSLYSGWALGPLTLSGDIGYTKSSNDITQTLPASMLMDPLKADVDNEAWAIGIRAEYQFNTPVMNITPYAALRYMRLTTDAYSVWTDPRYSTGSPGRVFDVDKDTQDLTRVPVGVIFSKDFMTSNAFKVSPRLDLGFIYTAGDRDAISVTSIPGVDATAKVRTLLVDKMTFNGSLGIDIKKKDFTLRLNYNYQNASHRSSNTFSGMLRFDF